MADTKISALNAGTQPSGGNTTFVAVQGGVDVKLTDTQLAAGIAAINGVNALSLISEVTTSGTQTSVTFSAIPSTWRDLVLRVRGRGAVAAAQCNVMLQFNGDTGANYDYEGHYATGATNAVPFGALQANAMQIGSIVAASATAGAADVIDILIANYKGTTFWKSAISQIGTRFTNAAAGLQVMVMSGSWRSTAKITDVVASLSAGGFQDGSVVSLYGSL